MITSDMKNWAVKNNVEEITQNSFWKAFENYCIDCPDEGPKYFGVIDKSKMDMRVKKLILVVDWEECENAYISARMPVIYKDSEIGYYELMFRLSGEIFDDYLVIDGIARI